MESARVARALFKFLCALIVAAFLSARPCAASQERDLKDLSLEELMNVEVTSVSKKTEKRSESPAAVYVITAEDIRRSGATTIMDVLRMAPGVYVARLDANKWSITMRGTSGRFANKLLVLIDGRSVYTPLYSGVEWEAKELPLEIIERIEVVRGPGGTLWGANAVNGIINIVTKSAKDSGGGRLVLRGGTEEASSYFRYGDRLGPDSAYKVYGKVTGYDHGEEAAGRAGNDDWERYLAGFRTDWSHDADSIMVQGDFYRSDITDRSILYHLVAPSRRVEKTGGGYDGASILGRWTRVLEEDRDFQLQLYYDYSRVTGFALKERRHTLDAQFQYRFHPTQRQEIVWGLEYRFFYDDLDGSFYAGMKDPRQSFQLLSGFVQDQITLSDKLNLWIGTKIEYNEFTGLEVQPSIRAAYTPDARQTLWAAVSRAVRTPSLIENDGLFTLAALPRVRVLLSGDDAFESEDLLAYELGYRLQMTKNAALDVSLFYHDYDHLRTLELRTPYFSIDPLPLHVVAPFNIENNASAQAYGVEVGLDWKPIPQLRTRLAYTWSELAADVHPETFDPITVTLEDDTPEQQVYLQAMWDIAAHWELDAVLRYVDPLPAYNVDDYLTGDLRLAWKPRENLEFSLVGQNLFQPDHEEFAPSFVNTIPTNVERSVYGQVSWRF